MSEICRRCGLRSLTAGGASPETEGAAAASDSCSVWWFLPTGFGKSICYLFSLTTSLVWLGDVCHSGVSTRCPDGGSSEESGGGKGVWYMNCRCHSLSFSITIEQSVGACANSRHQALLSSPAFESLGTRLDSTLHTAKLNETPPSEFYQIIWHLPAEKNGVISNMAMRAIENLL